MHVTEVFTTCMIQRVTAHPYRGVDSPGNHTGTPTYQHCERWAGGPSENFLYSGKYIGLFIRRLIYIFLDSK